MPETPSEIVAALYRAAAGGMAWSEPLRMVGDAVGGAFTLIGVVDKATSRTSSITSEAFAPERRDLYRGRYFSINPRVKYSARSPAGKVFFDAALARDVELGRHPYYAEFLAERGFTHFISANLINLPSRRVNLSVQRSRRAGHVDEAQVRAFESLVPHALAAFDLHEKLQSISAPERLAIDAWDLLDVGALVLDERGELAFANKAAIAMTDASGPFKSEGRSVVAANSESRDEFARTIAAALQDADGAIGARPVRMTLLSAARRPFDVTVRPMPNLGPANERGRRHLLVLAAPVRPLSSSDELQRLLGLTAGEAELALAVADGMSPGDYARDRGIAADALRARLLSLRGKLVEAGSALPLSVVLRQAEGNGVGADQSADADRTDGAAKFCAPKGGRSDWAAQYGLTGAEERLAEHLLNGGTTASYAALSKLSRYTVRNQLQSIYEKTRTNRQVSLLRLLLHASGKETG